MDYSVKFLPNYSRNTISFNGKKRSVTPAIANRKAINKIISCAKEIFDRDFDRYLRPKKSTTPLPFQFAELPTRRCKSACAKMLETQAVYSNLIHPTTRRKSISNLKKKPADKSNTNKLVEKTKTLTKFTSSRKSKTHRDTYNLLNHQNSHLKTQTSSNHTSRPQIMSDISNTAKLHVHHARATTLSDTELLAYSKKLQELTRDHMRSKADFTNFKKLFIRKELLPKYFKNV